MKCFYLLFLIIVIPSNINSQNKPISGLGSQGMELVYDMKFNEAESVFNDIIKCEPKNGLGYFLKSVCYFWMCQKYLHNEEIIEKYKEITFKAIEIAEETLDKNEDDIDAMFYLGGAYGNLGRYYTMEKSYLKAYWYGKKGKNILKDVIEINPKYYDAYVGLGIYHYYAAELPKIIKIFSFILGIEGDKELGLKELKLSAVNAKYTKTEAKFFLAAIYCDVEKDFKKALTIAEELHKQYPQNSTIVMVLGKCNWELGKYDTAIKHYQYMMDKYPNDDRIKSYYNAYGYKLINIGYVDEAINVFKKQVEILPNDANSYDSLGDGYKSLGKIDLAIEQYEKALTIDPKYEASRKKLDELKNHKS